MNTVRVNTAGTHTTTIPSPVGPLTLVATTAGLSRCAFRSVAGAGEPDPAATAWLDLGRQQLDAYFAGELQEFTIPLDLSRVGQPHRRILEELAVVRYGTTTTYGRLAGRAGLVEDGARTVGAAMARNPIAIILGCHRVLGADGRLTGYAGGLPTKQRLLDLEARFAGDRLTLAW